MDHQTAILCTTAASVALLHTVLGPDHYLPFIAMGRAGRWSLRKTVWVTVACGVGHVLGSVVIGFAGITLGVSLLSVEGFESFRGEIAGWLLLGFGLVYFVWGLRRAVRNRPHTHWHAHADGTVHRHEHVHHGDHVHVHQASVAARPGDHAKSRVSQSYRHVDEAPSLTPWVLFVIFLFGPCEPLIPILMYPAAQGRLLDVVIVSVVFGLTTLAAMTGLVALAHSTTKSMRFRWFERYAHALTGFVVLLCGVAVTTGL